MRTKNLWGRPAARYQRVGDTHFLLLSSIGDLEQCMWCNEKIHSILHAPRTLVRMGRSQNISCQVTETRHKGVKRKGSRTNRNPGTSGMSIMKTELKEAACQRMADALDETGISEFNIVSVCICVYHVCIGDVYVSICFKLFVYFSFLSICQYSPRRPELFRSVAKAVTLAFWDR